MIAPHPSPLPAGERVGVRGLNLGDWNLFEICCLEFDAFEVLYFLLYALCWLQPAFASFVGLDVLIRFERPGGGRS